MGRTRPAAPSMQDLIEERRRARFVGRDAERDAFRDNFGLPLDDGRRRYLFHVHGDAGVGKTFLLGEFRRLAEERGALTAYADDAAGGPADTMAALAGEFARQGHRFRELDRLLDRYREARHAARSAAEEGDPREPSAVSLAAARASLVALGLVPAVGAFAGAVDPAQLAQGVDRLRAGAGPRPRGGEDGELVAAPERVLTPVLLDGLAEAAAEVPWIVLFLDAYERTGPFLDAWLHDVMTTRRYGTLPGNVVVVTAGQRPFDTACWGGLPDFVAELPLAPFTEAETRGLLAARGVVAEPVVGEVLRLTGGLPVLVSALAETRPAGPEAVADPSGTAVERFLRWERDPVRRAAALAGALPRTLDADVFRVAADCAEEEAAGLFGWLRGLSFVGGRGDRLRYHDVVRAPMLRLQRTDAPRAWTARHERLAGAYGGWRAEAAAGLDADELWADEAWRELRLAELYHLLCAAPRTALPVALRDAADACGAGGEVARDAARTLAQAGEDTGAEAPRAWGAELLGALERGGVPEALRLLLARGGFDARGQAAAHVLRGRALGHGGDHARALVEYDRAVALDPGLAAAHHGRGVSRARAGDHAGAVADLDRAEELAPGRPETLLARGDCHRLLGRPGAALADLDRALALDPARPAAWAARGVARHALGRLDEALADLDRALEADPGYLWALVRRARVRRSRHEHAAQLADLDRAVELHPDSPWARCERGDALRAAGRHEEALADYDRALALDPAYASAYASRGASRRALGRPDEALADLDRALEAVPAHAWALRQRALLHLERDAPEQALADADRAAGLRPDDALVLCCRGTALARLRRFDEALAELDRAVALDPHDTGAVRARGTVLHALDRRAEALRDFETCLGLALALGTGPRAAELGRLADVLDGLSAPDAGDPALAPLRARVAAAREA